jgi:hypothetical protein
MKNLGLISTEKKMINDKNFNSILQGKKIDFNDDYMFIENDQTRNQNIIINNINNQNINYKPKISLSNKKTINRAYISAQPLTPNNNNIVQKVKCTCTKTGCLKKYCYCFAKGIPCEDCECKNCQNRGKENNNNDNINNINNSNNNNKQKISIPINNNKQNKIKNLDLEKNLNFKIKETKSTNQFTTNSSNTNIDDIFSKSKSNENLEELHLKFVKIIQEAKNIVQRQEFYFDNNNNNNNYRFNNNSSTVIFVDEIDL